jgi:serine/threonine protein kinase
LNRDSLFCEDEDEYEKWVQHINSFSKGKETIDDYKMLELLGQGKFSIVHKGIRIENNQEVAVKIIRKSKMEQMDLEHTRREISILQICEHSNIIKIKSYHENFEYIYIIQELFHSEDLYDFLKRRKFIISENIAKIIIRQLVSAIEYMHNIGVIHRDIKPENILVQLEDNDIRIKIIDFGL